MLHKSTPIVRPAIEEPGKGLITYREICDLSDRLRDRLHHLGVGRGDRVGIYTGKSIDAVASIYGILKTGAADAPLDPNAPIARNAYIVHDCALKALVLEERFKAELRVEDPKNRPNASSHYS